MKTRIQKATELSKAEKLLDGSKTLLFMDFSTVPSEAVRGLRRDLRAAGSSLLVIKKRLLGVLFKRKGYDVDVKQFGGAVGAVFSADTIDKPAGPLVKFFKERKQENEKVLGGYEIGDNRFIDAKTVVFIGQLPPREAILGQLVGLLASPIRSFMYVLGEVGNKRS
jgi:large subunit ribosomal protein L10